MNSLPRNMNLKAFDPHRKTFVCKHEADAVPPIDPQAEQWHREALALTSNLLWADDRDYPKAAALWQQAAERRHWKAILNLATAYAYGRGVERDSEHAVQIVEAAMQLGIPAAFDLMGTYHMEGLGVSQSADRAYAFWQLAADMGSATAQAYLGPKLLAIRDMPDTDVWGNIPVGSSMLECGYAQGNGSAALELGRWLNIGEHDYPRALKILHDGVKFGSQLCASYLFTAFDRGEPLTSGIKDRWRAERYRALSDALWRDSDLRLPNLDKVLPLPPAVLPIWDSRRDSLVEAAKPVVPIAPPPPASAASQRTGRAHIPPGFVLPAQPQIGVPPAYETTAASTSGYWIAQLLHPLTPQHAAWNAAQTPMRYAQGEPFDTSRPGLADDDGRIMFHYLGEPVADPAAAPTLDARVRLGVARAVAPIDPPVRRRGHERVPHTGIWQAALRTDHPGALAFNDWLRQFYLDEGTTFPLPQAGLYAVDAQDVHWLFRGQANAMQGADAYVGIDGRMPDSPST